MPLSVNSILVSGASGIVGYGILRSLRSAEVQATLIGSTIYEDSVAQGFCDTFEKAPHTSDPNYIPWLLSIIKKHKIDFLIPGIELDLYKWTECATEIESSGAKILLNAKELISLCKDKWLFYSKLSSFNTSYAIESTLESDFDELTKKFNLPFLLKPRIGYASRGIVRVENKEVFERHKSLIGKLLMAQPIVGTDNEEYTTSAFCDGQGGFYASMTLKRKLSTDGFTEKAEVVNFEGINKAVKDLCSIFKPIGPTNFQFRRLGENWKLLEINPRISSSTSIRAAFGYNESQMALDFFLKGKIPSQPTIRKGRAVRYLEDFIFFETTADSEGYKTSFR